jgi:predicted nucleic acid-binding protein
MYLVDTSVWISYLQDGDSPAAALLDKLLGNPLAIGINHQIYLEILQGAKDKKTFDQLDSYFSGQRFHGFSEAAASYREAARIYFNCRRNGITIRSSIDCLIAQCALENDLILLHEDRDYLRMQTYLPDLKQEHFLHH